MSDDWSDDKVAAMASAPRPSTFYGRKTMDLDNLISGLIGAAAASVLAYFSTSALDNRRATEERRGAARALYFEVVNNAVYLRHMAEGSVPIRHLATETWAATMPLVANLLKPLQFKTVAVAYFVLNAGRPNIDAAMVTGESAYETRKVWASDSADFDLAADVLRMAAYSEEERKELAKQLRP